MFLGCTLFCNGYENNNPMVQLLYSAAILMRRRTICYVALINNYLFRYEIIGHLLVNYLVIFKCTTIVCQ